MAACLLPNVCAIYAGSESYPYTNAPMFGHYVGDATYFYDVAFISEAHSVDERVFPYTQAPVTYANYLDMRFFFNKIYGSAEKRTPFKHFEHDTSKDLEARMNAFFLAYFKHLRVGEAGAGRRIRCDINRYDSQQRLLDSHTVGYYDLALKKFKHTWKQSH